MEKKCANPSIECSVRQCEHHCKEENFCALERVRIATHEANPTEVKCVDCESFKLDSKAHGASC